jgi:hypothetical protein
MVVGALVLAALALGMASALSGTPPTYSATATIAGVPRKGTTTGSDLLGLANSRFVAFITSPTTQENLADREGVPLEIIEATEVVNQPATNNIIITSHAADPAQAALVANIVAALAVQYSGSDDLIKQEVVAPAVTAE